MRHVSLLTPCKIKIVFFKYYSFPIRKCHSLPFFLVQLPDRKRSNHLPQKCPYNRRQTVVLRTTTEMRKPTNRFINNVLSYTSFRSHYLQLFEYSPTRMILLFMGKPQVSHILAENINAVRVFTAGRSASHFLHPGNNAQRSIDNNGWIFLSCWLRPKVQTIIGDG